MSDEQSKYQPDDDWEALSPAEEWFALLCLVAIAVIILGSAFLAGMKYADENDAVNQSISHVEEITQ